MFYVVYIDVLFLVNFFMDFIVLTLTGNFLRLRAGILKRISGAAFGACCYCIMLYLPWECRLWGSGMLMLLTACIMGKMVFSVKGIKGMAQFLLVFHAAAFFLEGTATAVYHYTKLGYYIRKAVKGDLYAQIIAGTLAGMVIVSCLLIKMTVSCIRKRQIDSKIYYEVELFKGNRRKKATALLDTGNHLKEPVSGKPVVLADMTFAGELLEEEIKTAVREFYETGDMQAAGEAAACMRLVPYHSVGRKHGLLAAVFFDRLTIQMEQNVIEKTGVCIAITEEPVSVKDGYQVILNAELVG